VRFGRHTEIEVSYKIIWLEVPKLVPICTIQLIFNRGYLEAVLSINTLCPLGVKDIHCKECIFEPHMYYHFTKINLK
jgi:hypothetical protein